MKRFDMLLVAFIVGIALILAYFVFFQTLSNEVSYKIEVEKVDYAFPSLNVTLAINENIPDVNKFDILYQERMIAHQEFPPQQFNEGDKFTVLLTLEGEEQPNKPLTLRIYFKGNYQDFTIQIP